MARRRWTVVLAIVATAAAGLGARAQVDVATVPYEPGDLIFIAGHGAEAAALKQLTGSPLTEVGLLRETGGGPYVLFASPEFDTDEVPLDEFLARSTDGQYALYRPREGRSRGLNPPTVRVAYDKFYLAPYDPFYREDREALYGAEMIRTVFGAAGIPLGEPQPMRLRGSDEPAVRWYFMADWRARPDCAGLEEETCWQRVQDLRIVTPADLAASPALQLVKSTFTER